MATYTADTELARELAGTFLVAADAADELGASVLTALGLSELESDALVRADELSDQLERSGVIVEQQADLLDGVELDLETFAERLEQDPDELARQLDLLLELGLGAEGEIIPLVLWDGDFFAPDSLRDVFIGLPEPGVDVDVDAALIRLDDWFLPLLKDGGFDADDVKLTAAREADLLLIGAFLVPDGFTVEVSEIYRGRKDGDDYTEVRTKNVELLALGGPRLLEFLATTFTEHAAMGRLAVPPSIEDIIDLLVARNEAAYQEIADTPTNRGDNDDRREAERRKRQALERFDRLDRDELLATYGDLDWLGAVLAGLAPPPTDPADRDLLRAFAAEFDFASADDSFDQALLGLRVGGLVQDQLVLDDPTNGRLLFNDELIPGVVEHGLRAGAINEALVADAERVAQALLGQGIDLDGPPPALDADAFVQALALRVDHSVLDQNQVIAALAYVTSADTAGQQLDRLRDALLSLQTVSHVGVPVMTAPQIERAVGSDVWDFLNSRSFERGRRYKDGDDWVTDYSDVPTHLDGRSEQWEWVVEHLGVPGYHKERWHRRRLHFGVDVDGTVAGFQVERIPPKKSLFGTVFKAVFIIVAGAMQQWYMVAAMAAHQGMEAYEAGGWEAALMAAAGTFLLAAGGASLASWVAPAAATGTAAAGAGAGAGAATGTAAAGAGAGAGAAASSTTAVVGTFGNVAVTASQGVSAGITAYNAFQEDDILDGIVAGTEAVAVVTGASSLQNLATVARGVDQTVEGIDDGDVVDIVAGVATTGAGALNLSADMAGADSSLYEGLRQGGHAFDAVATATVKVDATVQAIEDGDVAAAVQNGLGAVSATATLFAPGTVGADVLGLDPAQQQAVQTIVETTQAASTTTGAVDAARRGEVLDAIQLLSQAAVEVEGGSDASVVAHRAEQLRAVLEVAEVLIEADGDTTFTELADALAPALTSLGEAGQPLPDGAPMAASFAGEALLEAGEATWEFFSPPIVDDQYLRNSGDEVIVVVGGFGDSLTGTVQEGLLDDIAADNPDADVLFLSWDAVDEGAAFLEQYQTDNPAAPITVVGHSYGGDAALAIAEQASTVQGINIVTLDPVSWNQNARPDNVASWFNVTVPGINDHTDVIAAIGGHYGPQVGAENIPVPQELLDADLGFTHGDARGLYSLYEGRLFEHQQQQAAEYQASLSLLPPPIVAEELPPLDVPDASGLVLPVQRPEVTIDPALPGLSPLGAIDPSTSSFSTAGSLQVELGADGVPIAANRHVGRVSDLTTGAYTVTEGTNVETSRDLAFVNVGERSFTEFSYTSPDGIPITDRSALDDPLTIPPGVQVTLAEGSSDSVGVSPSLSAGLDITPLGIDVTSTESDKVVTFTNTGGALEVTVGRSTATEFEAGPSVALDLEKADTFPASGVPVASPDSSILPTDVGVDLSASATASIGSSTQEAVRITVDPTHPGARELIDEFVTTRQVPDGLAHEVIRVEDHTGGLGLGVDADIELGPLQVTGTASLQYNAAPHVVTEVTVVDATGADVGSTRTVQTSGHVVEHLVDADGNLETVAVTTKLRSDQIEELGGAISPGATYGPARITFTADELAETTRILDELADGNVGPGFQKAVSGVTYDPYSSDPVERIDHNFNIDAYLNVRRVLADPDAFADVIGPINIPGPIELPGAIEVPGEGIAAP